MLARPLYYAARAHIVLATSTPPLRRWWLPLSRPLGELPRWIPRQRPVALWRRILWGVELWGVRNTIPLPCFGCGVVWSYLYLLWRGWRRGWRCMGCLYAEDLAAWDAEHGEVGHVWGYDGACGLAPGCCGGSVCEFPNECDGQRGTCAALRKGVGA